ncbi:UNVERIFIED_CONTAM: hypothetical protein Slati_1457000 [Sesamum latifolium]|uniref:Uncharacterized protein n=1 Tax=Sesamum latifolium TaxID=2727402 RepID=A0AAW2X9Z1_9LAMI
MERLLRHFDLSPKVEPFGTPLLLHNHSGGSRGGGGTPPPRSPMGTPRVTSGGSSKKSRMRSLRTPPSSSTKPSSGPPPPPVLKDERGVPLKYSRAPLNCLHSHQSLELERGDNLPLVGDLMRGVLSSGDRQLLAPLSQEELEGIASSGFLLVRSFFSRRGDGSAKNRKYEKLNNKSRSGGVPLIFSQEFGV